MIKDSVYTLITRIIIIIGKLAYSIVVNRTLGPVLKGVFELIQIAPDTLTRFGTLGFEQANTYLSGREKDKIPALISNSFGIMARFAFPAVILGIGYMLLPTNQKIFEHTPQWVGFLALIVIPVAIIDLLLESIVYGENRIWARNVHELIRVFSALIFMGTFVFLMRLEVKGAVFGYVLLNLAILTFTIFVLRRYHPIKIRKLDLQLAWKAFSFGGYMWGANFASFLFYKVDQWLISALAKGTTEQVLEQVGLYSTAVNVIVNIWIIPDSIQTALLPKITRKGESERKKLVPPSLRAVTILVFLAMIILAFVARPALDIMYNRADRDWDFTLAVQPLMLLMPGIFTLSLAKVFTADLFSRGKPWYAMWVSITSLILNLTMNFILIPSDFVVKGIPISGMNGAAVASSISYTFSFLMFLYFYVKESGERSRDIFLPKKSDFVLIYNWLRGKNAKEES